MRRFLVLAALLSIPVQTSPQDPEPRESRSGRSYFGAPVLKITQLGDQGAVMLGGRGGWAVAPTLFFGFGLYGTLSEVDAPVAGPSGPLDLKLETFGLEMEYGLPRGAPTRFTLGALLGGGAARYVRDGTNSQEGETDFVLLLEPAVGVQQRVAGWMHVQVAASYRVVGSVEQAGLLGEDLRGPAASLAVKLGRP
jgi:hypothetical protein